MSAVDAGLGSVQKRLFTVILMPNVKVITRLGRQPFARSSQFAICPALDVVADEDEAYRIVTQYFDTIRRLAIRIFSICTTPMMP
jgi:hypothetical protein